jgi:hypothetical protein
MKKTILLFILISAVSAAAISPANAQVFSVGVSIHVGPPVIPVYTQPACPVDGYLWVPGYWAYADDNGYYWVPGYWAAPPTVGFLWTPGYWGYVGGIYSWNAGYWGPHIGFYGGVNYGCGYGGVGYAGGGWVGGHFRYNTAVTNVNTTVIHNTYVDRTVVNNVTVNRVSYNGGPGGVAARPTPAEETAARDHHVEATSAQLSHQHNASIDRNQFAAVNHGRPSNVAVARPTAYHPANTVGSLSHGAGVNHAAPAVNHPAPAATRAPAVNHTPTPVVHRTVPVNHPATVNHPAARPMNHTATHPMNHPATHPATHPAPAPHGEAGGEHHPRG